MNIRTNIKSGQSTMATNAATISQGIDVAVGGHGVNVVTALNIGVVPQTSVAIGGGSVDISINLKP